MSKNIYKTLFFLTAILLSMAVQAEKMTMICKFDNGSEMMPFNIDLNTKKLLWGDLDTGWKLVGKIERYLTIKSPDDDKTVGGVYMVIDRYSGDFSQTTLSVIDSNRILGVAGKGVCSTKKF